jgi:SAM-dependent methyltransferase
VPGPTLAADRFGFGRRREPAAGLPGEAGDDEPMGEAAAELLTPDGEQLLELLAGLDVTPELALKLGAELRGRYPPELVAAALTQQSLRMAAREKFGRAAAMFFTRAGLEQASSDLTAAHSARRFAGLQTVADLCCGIGGNLAALAAVAARVVGVDADPTTIRFASRNVAVLAPDATEAPVCADVRTLALAGRGPAGEVALPGRGRLDGSIAPVGGRPAAGLAPARVDGVFIDPARRFGGRRLRTGASEPVLDFCLGLADQVPAVGIKAAPGLPHELVPAGWELEFVAVARSLKEALLWSPALATAPRRATVLPAGETLVGSPGDAVPVRAPGEYLLDPNPAVTRAGLVQDLARELDAWQIDPMIAFLSLNRPVSTPFARTLRVLESMPWHERRVALRLRELGVGSADIRRRGLAGDVARIHRRLGLQGDRSATIVITRRDGQPWGLICEPITADAGR